MVNKRTCCLVSCQIAAVPSGFIHPAEATLACLPKHLIQALLFVSLLYMSGIFPFLVDAEIPTRVNADFDPFDVDPDNPFDVEEPELDESFEDDPLVICHLLFGILLSF